MVSERWEKKSWSNRLELNLWYSVTHLKCKVQQAICLTSTFENHFRVLCMWVAENKKPIAIISMQICSKNVDAHQLWNSLKTNHGSSWNDDAFAIAQKSIAFLFWVVHSQLCVVRKRSNEHVPFIDISHFAAFNLYTRRLCVMPFVIYCERASQRNHFSKSTVKSFSRARFRLRVTINPQMPRNHHFISSSALAVIMNLYFESANWISNQRALLTFIKHLFAGVWVFCTLNDSTLVLHHYFEMKILVNKNETAKNSKVWLDLILI